MLAALPGLGSSFCRYMNGPVRLVQCYTWRLACTIEDPAKSRFTCCIRKKKAYLKPHEKELRLLTAMALREERKAGRIELPFYNEAKGELEWPVRDNFVPMDGVRLFQVTQEEWVDAVTNHDRYYNAGSGSKWMRQYTYEVGAKPPYDGGAPGKLIGAVEYGRIVKYYLAESLVNKKG